MGLERFPPNGAAAQHHADDVSWSERNAYWLEDAPALRLTRTRLRDARPPNGDHSTGTTLSYSLGRTR